MNVLLRLILVGLLVSAVPGVASAEDRQSGLQAELHDEKPVEKSDSAAKADAPKAEDRKPAGKGLKVPVASAPQPRTGSTMDRKAMESLGPLTNPLKGGLGDDMWSGSARSTVQTYLPKLPTGTTLKSIQLLTRRILLSNGDVSLMRNDASPEAGADLFTLRLEKLLEMGAYSDAVDLYTLIEGEPSHDRLARAGIMALMYDGYPAQACLEVRATHKDKAETPDSDSFWGQMDAVCNFIQVESVKKLNDPQLSPASPVTGIPGSKVLTSLVSRADYRYGVSTPADIAVLSDTERAVLKGLGRFDYSGLRVKKLEEVPSPILMIMAGDANLPNVQRLELSYEAAERGLIDDDRLGELYVEIAKQNQPATPSAEPPNTLEGRYVTALKPDSEGAERNSIVSFLLENHQGTPTALLPFADWVAPINPAGLSPKAIHNGLVLMLEDGITPPIRWVNAWLKTESGDSAKSDRNLMLYLANLVPENLPTESVVFTDAVVKKLFTSPESPETLDIYSVFSGLGRANTLHNYISQDIYEKHVDLTVPKDYVMPTDGLMDKLHEAAKNDRLGETVLLAAVALNQYDPAKTHPGVLQEALKSLTTVGLKEEARAVAVEVILTLKQ